MTVLMPQPASPGPLTRETFATGLGWLAARDPDLAQVLADLGPPPFWTREAGFPTLIHIILEQQVSLASAQAAFGRLCTAVSPLTPEGFLDLDDIQLRAVGFSRQKAGYARHAAQEIVAGRFDPDGLAQLEDDQARAELVRLKGVGRWTADVYLLMALRRPDSWPSGDLALAEAVRRAKQLDTRPAPAELEALSTPWRPWRAVAARLLWHLYLSS